MHINHGATLRGKGSSYVDDPDFFLAPHGKQDAAAELRANWQALKAPDSAARCRFPARYRFLAEHLGWQESEPFSHCKEYLNWRDDMPIGQLVLVFPAAYLNSPSSMFGHTLLRLDDQPEPKSVWLSRSINFGAEVPQDNSITYIWRGLVGGYPGQFSVVTYGKKIRDYGFLENRDIWEYALNLNRDELDWIVSHLWELNGINFDYFFFDENCSYRLLELIKVGRPSSQLMQGFRFAELPVNTVRTLYENDLVIERRYRPSKVHELQHLAAQLEKQELRWSHRLMAEPEQADTPAFEAFETERRYLMAQVAYQALRVENRSGPRDDDVARRSLSLLRVVHANQAPSLPPIPEPSAPETGHPTKMASVSGGRRGGHEFLELGFRLTYHDILDPLSGFLPGAGIEGLNVRLRATESQGLNLERLDLVNIRSIAPRGQFVKPTSWFVHGGLEQVLGEQEGRSLGLFLQGGPGASWRLGTVQPYVFAVGRIEGVSGAEPTVTMGGGAETGFIYYRPNLQLGLNSQILYFDESFYRHRTQLTADVPISRNNALRAGCAYEARNGHGGGENVGQNVSQSSCQLEWRHFF